MKLTKKYIESRIIKEEYTKLGEKTTVGCFTLSNGFEVVTSSACVNPNEYNEDIGKEICKQKAIDKVWELEGYILQEFNDLKEKCHTKTIIRGY